MTALGFKFWVFLEVGTKQSPESFPLLKKEFFGGSNFSYTSTEAWTMSSVGIVLAINGSLPLLIVTCLCHQKCVDVWQRNYNLHLSIVHLGDVFLFSESSWVPHLVKMAMRHAHSRMWAGEAQSAKKPPLQTSSSCGFGVSWPEGSGTKLAVQSFDLQLQALLW